MIHNNNLCYGWTVVGWWMSVEIHGHIKDTNTWITFNFSTPTISTTFHSSKISPGFIFLWVRISDMKSLQCRSFQLWSESIMKPAEHPSDLVINWFITYCIYSFSSLFSRQPGELTSIDHIESHPELISWSAWIPPSFPPSPHSQRSLGLSWVASQHLPCRRELFRPPPGPAEPSRSAWPAVRRPVRLSVPWWWRRLLSERPCGSGETLPTSQLHEGCWWGRTTCETASLSAVTPVSFVRAGQVTSVSLAN